MKTYVFKLGLQGFVIRVKIIALFFTAFMYLTQFLKILKNPFTTNVCSLNVLRQKNSNLTLLLYVFNPPM
jgi:uncharacterized protein with PQ loop repeat